MVGGAVMVVAAYADGTDALSVTLALTVLTVAAARITSPLDLPPERLVPDLMVSAFVAVYVPLLAASAVLMAASDDGPDRDRRLHPGRGAQRHRRVRRRRAASASTLSPRRSARRSPGRDWPARWCAATVGSAVAVPLLLGRAVVAGCAAWASSPSRPRPRGPGGVAAQA